MTDISRRSLLRTTGLAAATAVAGCSSGGSSGGSTDAPGDIVVGPDGAYVYEPEEYTVSVGDTVTWSFASPGHNVSCDPEYSGQASLPDDAEPFASHDDGNPVQTLPKGETFEYTFETAGEYTYVCVPHARQGMVGTVMVE